MNITHEHVDTADAYFRDHIRRRREPHGNVLRWLNDAETEVLIALRVNLDSDADGLAFRGIVEHLIDVRISDGQIASNEQLRETMVKVEKNQRRIECVGILLSIAAIALAAVEVWAQFQTQDVALVEWRTELPKHLRQPNFPTPLLDQPVRVDPREVAPERPTAAGDTDLLGQVVEGDPGTRSEGNRVEHPSGAPAEVPLQHLK